MVLLQSVESLIERPRHRFHLGRLFGLEFVRDYLRDGAILPGVGGDNSHGAAGTFYEGVMTSGYPSEATENAVQANIVAAQYR